MVYIKAFILTLFILILSCVVPEVDYFTFNYPQFDNMDNAAFWVSRNIDYKKDSYDNWKLPQETIRDGNGDCEDQAILLMNIMKYQKGYKPDLVVVEINVNGRSQLHAIVKHKNKYYDAVSGESYKSLKYKHVSSYNFDQTMYTAKYIKNY